MVYITLFRLFVGLLGSFLCLQIVYTNCAKIHDYVHERLILLGKNSLGIYIISNYLFELILVPVSRNLSGPNYIITIFETCVISIFSLWLIKVIKKSNIIKILEVY